MSPPFHLLAINPGATSTKLGLFEDERELARASLSHPDDELARYPRVADQLPLRRRALGEFLERLDPRPAPLDAVVGRGGLLRPLASGTYRVDATMLSELRAAERGDHASNLGALLAYDLAGKTGAPAFIVDPVCVDELAPVAR